MTTDFRALCAELLAALEIQLDELRFNNRLCLRARAALAKSVPPADGDVAELVVWLRCQKGQIPGSYTEFDRRIDRAADILEFLAPQPVPEGPSDKELCDLLQVTFARRLYQGPSHTTLENDFARAVLARWGRQP